jgi:hypothetical protein
MATCCVRLVAVANAICLTLLSTASYAQQGTQQEVAPPVPVAVFVFSNITGETADDWMGAGIAETVATGLDGVGELMVIRTDPSEIGPGPSSRVRSPIELHNWQEDLLASLNRNRFRTLDRLGATKFVYTHRF